MDNHFHIDPLFFLFHPQFSTSELWHKNCVVKNYELLDLAGGDSKKLYGMVQCTRDLSCNNCFKCLDSIIAELPSCCINGKVGGKVGAESCNIRYEMYPRFRF